MSDWNELIPLRHCENYDQNGKSNSTGIKQRQDHGLIPSKDDQNTGTSTRIVLSQKTSNDIKRPMKCHSITRGPWRCATKSKDSKGCQATDETSRNMLSHEIIRLIGQNVPSVNTCIYCVLCTFEAKFTRTIDFFLGWTETPTHSQTSFTKIH